MPFANKIRKIMNPEKKVNLMKNQKIQKQKIINYYNKIIKYEGKNFIKKLIYYE